MSDMAERLKLARTKAGYPKATAGANAMGKTVSTYLAHENGTSGFKRDDAIRYATFYRVSLAWLLSGKGSMDGPSAVEEIFERIPDDRRDEALRYLDFLARRD